MNELTNQALVEQVRGLLEASRQRIAVEVNTTLLHTYWEIGKVIVEDEALHIGDVAYEKQSLRQLSKALTTEFGKGFSRSNLSNMRQFYLTHKNVQTVSGQLSWSHYCELLSISDSDKRSFYEKETINAGWSVRELRRQIESSLFERLLLSSGDSNREKVLSRALKGNEIATPADIIRDPYCIIGSDGLTRSWTEKGHPRASATFPHALNWFVKEKKILTLEECIRKMTGQTADFFGIRNKGYIREGYDADLVLFDFDRLHNPATYRDPNRVTEGMDLVFVGGTPVWENGAFTGENPGRVLRFSRS